jgi:hypothetical protein
MVGEADLALAVGDGRGREVRAVGRTMTADEFVTYARGQVASIDVILESHRPEGRACACGRQLPCSAVETLTTRRTHFLSKIAIAETTVPLPAVIARVDGRKATAARWTARVACWTVRRLRLASFAREVGRCV